MRWALWSGVAWVAAAGAVLAQEAESTVRLAVSATPEPRPALRYWLLPDPAELRPGNAAIHYYKALGFVELPNPLENFSDQLAAWQDLPLDQLPLAEVDQCLAQCRTLFAELDRAARCDHCRWDDHLREEGMNALLPHVQRMRGVARLVILRARAHLARGDHEAAIGAVQTLLAMALHTAAGETMIHDLVGMALVQSAVQPLEELIGSPGAPNLYWALTVLPRPLVSVRQGLAMERHLVDFSFPQLRELERRVFTAEEALELAAGIEQLSTGVVDGQKGVPLEARARLLAMSVAAFAPARAALLAAGRKAEELDRMPMLQVVLLHGYGEYRQFRDDDLKWSLAPAYEAGWLERLQARRAAIPGHGNSVLGLLAQAQPALSQVGQNMLVTETRWDALRVLEALRRYAAGHEGRWPAALAEVDDVPVPVRAGSGEPFGYHVQGAQAILEFPSPRPGHRAYRYELTIRK
jgi:hypothetical protein